MYIYHKQRNLKAEDFDNVLENAVFQCLPDFQRFHTHTGTWEGDKLPCFILLRELVHNDFHVLKTLTVYADKYDLTTRARAIKKARWLVDTIRQDLEAHKQR